MLLVRYRLPPTHEPITSCHGRSAERSEFSVQSCGNAKRGSQRPNRETSRKSPLAFHALSSPLRPRHPNRPTSGHLQPSYMLVSTLLGGYGESLLSAGDRVSIFAIFEVKFAGEQPIEARVRAATANDARLLLETYRRAFQKQTESNGLVCEFTAKLDLDSEIAAGSRILPTHRSPAR